MKLLWSIAVSDEQPPRSSPPLALAELSRRRFLAVSALAASAATSAAALVAAAPGFAQGAVARTDSDPAFLELARFLTGKPDLDARIAVLARQGLIAADPAFAERSAALERAIKEAELTDVDAFAGSALYADVGHKATAIAVISAFYLGQVGEGNSAKFVSFEKALMYGPTAGVVVIPTYTLGGPNYWGTLTVPND
ncbi:MAG: sugar dehydrogenase complex small subunit [Gammaproteobacteria bacterium]